MSKKIIIGLAGRMRSGKGVITTAMSDNFNSDTVTVADGLKNLVVQIIPHICHNILVLNRMKNDGTVIDCGITDKDIKIISDRTNISFEDVKRECDNKKSWYDVRDMLQFIGTNIIRKYNPNWHIEKLVENINNSKKDIVCIDDVRFPNERKAVEDLGGKVFFIIRPQTETMTNHSAETSLKWFEFDHNSVIINDVDEITLQDNFVEGFKNNWMWNAENRIFLSANYNYLNDNYKFGIKLEGEEFDLLPAIIDQNYDKQHFKHDGIIVFNAETGEDAISFSKHVRNKYNENYFNGHKFVFYNPLVYENLKLFL